MIVHRYTGQFFDVKGPRDCLYTPVTLHSLSRFEKFSQNEPTLLWKNEEGDGTRRLDLVVEGSVITDFLLVIQY